MALKIFIINCGVPLDDTLFPTAKYCFKPGHVIPPCTGFRIPDSSPTDHPRDIRDRRGHDFLDPVYTESEMTCIPSHLSQNIRWFNNDTTHSIVGEYNV